MHSMGNYVKTWHHWTILVWRWEWRAAHCNKGVVRWGLTAVLDCHGPSKPWELQERLPVVPAGRGYSPYSHCDPWVTRSTLSPKTGQSTPRSREFPLFTRLDPPDFFLWGYLKDCVYQNNPNTIPELKQAITQNIRAITKQECIRVIDKFARCLQAFLQQKGGHLEHIL